MEDRHAFGAADLGKLGADLPLQARAIALMRLGLGGHPFATDEGVPAERRRRHVGPFRNAGRAS